MKYKEPFRSILMKQVESIFNYKDTESYIDPDVMHLVFSGIDDTLGNQVRRDTLNHLYE